MKKFVVTWRPKSGWAEFKDVVYAPDGDAARRSWEWAHPQGIALKAEEAGGSENPVSPRV